MQNSNILKNLFFQLMQKKVRFASWKNNHELDLALAGETDIDLLLHPSDMFLLLDLLSKYGFIEGEAKVLNYPSVYHYYCYDAGINKLIHIHLYSKIITGESHTKNYHFPIEAALLERVILDERGVPVLHPSDQLLVYLLRHFIKISCLPGLFLYMREKQSYNDEFNAIQMHVVDSVGIYPSGNLVIDSLNFFNLRKSYNSNFFVQYFVGLKVRYIVNGFSRYNLVENFYQRYIQIVYRLLNKLFFKKKKRLIGKGKFIAITGLDGTGKSSTVDYLNKIFNGNFDCKVIHIGLPNPTLLTFPFRWLLNTFKYFVNNPELITKKEDIAKPTSIPRALRYAVLAYERYKTTKQAMKLASKGCIVIADRFPSKNIGVMDSRRIIGATNGSYIIKLLSNFEARCYEFCELPDLLLNLTVPVDVSLDRNRKREKEGKETDEEIIERYRINSNLTYKAYSVIEVDMDRDKDKCMREICSLIWYSVSGLEQSEY